MVLETRRAVHIGALVACVIAGCKDDAQKVAGDTEATGGGSGSDTAGDDDGSDGSTAAASDDTDGTPDGPDPASVIEALVAARCGWLFRCCALGEIGLQLGPFTQSESECVERVIAVLQAGSPGVPIDAGPSDLLLALVQAYALDRITLDADAVATCVDHLADAECTPAPEADGHCDPARSQPLVDPCALDLIAIGKQAVGDACEPVLQAECVPGARCVDFGTTGVCAALASEDDPCFVDTDCVEPLVCDLVGDGRCEEGAALGAACTFADPDDPIPGTEVQRCARGLTCDPSTFVCVGGTCGTGAPCVADSQCPVDHFCVLDVCLAPQPGGGPCETNAHCLSNLCSLGTNTCSAVQGQPNGAACFSGFSCQSGFCDPVALVCTPPNEPGEPCPSNQAAQCLDGFCDTTVMPSVCVAYAQNGEPCMFTSDCAPGQSLTCIANVCSLLADGASCFSNTQCESGLCFVNVCDQPLAIGDTCGAAAMGRPCEAGAFCEISLGSTNGMCRVLKASGSPCIDHTECWGQCITAWGEQMCDATPAEGSAWCDGEP